MPRKKTMGRGANGTGSIRKITTTRNGKPYTYWQARYTEGYDPGTGKQIQRSITGKTQKEVAQKLKQVTYELDQGTYQAPNKQALGEWLDLWAETYLGAVKPRTVEIYTTIIRIHIKPALGATKLDSLTTSTIQRFYNNLTKESGISAKYLKNIHGVLHKSLQQAVLIGLLRTNPTAPCVLPRIEKKELLPFDDTQITAFLQQIQGAEFETLLTVTLFTGLRQGEVLGLMWDCVDFESGTLLINKQLQYFREESYIFRIVPTKNGKGRVIKPAPSVMSLLKAHKETQARQRLLAGDAWEDSNLVFTDNLGHHLNNSIVYRHFKRAAAAIGRPDARFHDLRHSYAVASIRSGDDIKTVQDNLGHATASFTLDVYGHVTEQMKQASANRMEQFFQSVAPQADNKAKNKAKL